MPDLRIDVEHHLREGEADVEILRAAQDFSRLDRAGHPRSEGSGASYSVALPSLCCEVRLSRNDCKGPASRSDSFRQTTSQRCHCLLIDQKIVKIREDLDNVKPGIGSKIMSTATVSPFESSIHVSNAWLKELMEELRSEDRYRPTTLWGGFAYPA